MHKWPKLRIGNMGVVATKAGLRPGDFELGSLESRAAARALAERQHRLATDSECEAYPPGWSPKTAAQKSALDSAADILTPWMTWLMTCVTEFTRLLLGRKTTRIDRSRACATASSTGRSHL
jgi:hypothetical protein